MFYDRCEPCPPRDCESFGRIAPSAGVIAKFQAVGREIASSYGITHASAT